MYNMYTYIDYVNTNSWTDWFQAPQMCALVVELYNLDLKYVDKCVTVMNMLPYIYIHKDMYILINYNSSLI